MTDTLYYLALAWAAFAVAAASPGPATLLIAATSMARGRRAGVAVAAGVMAGSFFWGVLAAAGFAALLAVYGWLAQGLRIAGGLFLLYLAIRAALAAWRNAPLPAPETVRGGGVAGHMARGAALHLTNPKAVFGWLAVVSVGMPTGMPAYYPFLIVLSCGALGIAIFGGYALLFATGRAQAAYRASKRVVDAASALVFGGFGLVLLARRV